MPSWRVEFCTVLIAVLYASLSRESMACEAKKIPWSNKASSIFLCASLKAINSSKFRVVTCSGDVEAR